MRIVFKATRMLSLLKRICPLITDIKVRRTLSISHEITAFLCDSGMVSCKCQSESDLGKSPKVRNSLHTKN